MGTWEKIVLTYLLRENSSSTLSSQDTWDFPFQVAWNAVLIFLARQAFLIILYLKRSCYPDVIKAFAIFQASWLHKGQIIPICSLLIDTRQAESCSSLGNKEAVKELQGGFFSHLFVSFYL